MGEEYPARTFRSGNSVALRLPAALGVAPGRRMTVRTDPDGRIIAAPAEVTAPRIGGDWIGLLPDLNEKVPEGRDIGDRPLDWVGDRIDRADG